MSGERLGQLVRERRVELGLSQSDIAERGGPSTATLYHIEAEQSPALQRVTRERLDSALGWERGSVAAVLTGGEPRVLTLSPGWARVGQLMITRRVELGYPRRADWIRHLQVDRPRTIEDFENGRRDNYQPSTVALMECYYGWAHGSVAAVLEGGEPVLAELGRVDPFVPCRPASAAGMASIEAARSCLAAGTQAHADRAETVATALFTEGCLQALLAIAEHFFSSSVASTEVKP